MVFPYVEEHQIDIFLNKLNNNNSAEAKVYKGALFMFKSKYAVSPVNKYKHFKTGKNLIDEAVHLNPKNIEIRYIRLVFQHQLPDFLGYNKYKSEDLSVFKNEFTKSSLSKNTKAYFIKNMLLLDNLNDQDKKYLKAIL